MNIRAKEIREEILAWRSRKKAAKKMDQFGMLHIARRKIIKLKTELKKISAT